MRFLFFSLICAIFAIPGFALERTVTPNNNSTIQTTSQNLVIDALTEKVKSYETEITTLETTLSEFETCAAQGQIYNNVTDSCQSALPICAEITVRDLMDNIGPENTIRGYTSTSGPKGGTIPERTQGEIVTVRTGTGRCGGGSIGGSIVYERDFICIMGNVVLASDTRAISSCRYPVIDR